MSIFLGSFVLLFNLLFFLSKAVFKEASLKQKTHQMRNQHHVDQ